VFSVQCSGCRVQGSRFRVQGAGFRVQGSGFRVRGPGAEEVSIALVVVLRPPCPAPRKVDVRLPGKGNSNSRGARPDHLIITMIQWIRTSSLSISVAFVVVRRPPCPAPRGSRSDSAFLISGFTTTRVSGFGLRVSCFVFRVSVVPAEHLEELECAEVALPPHARVEHLQRESVT